MINTLKFWINGEQHEVDSNLMERLSTYLKNIGLSGTKTSCKEGGCGCCTVVITTYNIAKQQFEHKSIVSCITPLAYIDNCSITTIEYVGSALNPNLIQQKFVEEHASQCGFCTPGFVMTLYCEMLNGVKNQNQLRKALDGNICRCTGYRPINNVIQDIEDCTIQQVRQPFVCEEMKFLYHNKIISNNKYCGMQFECQIVTIPTSYVELANAIEKFEQIQLVNGGTEVMIQLKNENKMSKNICMLNKLGDPLLNSIQFADGRVEIGGNVTISQFLDQIMSKPLLHKFFEPALSLFASTHIRNVATIAGNIATQSPLSDTIPIFMALGADIAIINAKTFQTRVISIDNFNTDYRKNCLEKFEIIQKISFAEENVQYAYFQKLSRRRQDDMSVINCCSCFVVKNRIIQQANVVFGCLGIKTMHLTELENAFKDINVDQVRLENIMENIGNLVSIFYNVQVKGVGTYVEPYAQYKTAMTAYITRRHFCSLLKDCGIKFCKEEFDYVEKFRFSLEYEQQQQEASPPYLGALQCATGEADFVSNMQLAQNCLHAYPIYAGIPKGVFKYNFSLDVLKQKYPQVVDFVTAKDIKGSKTLGMFQKTKLILEEEDGINSPSDVLGIVVTKNFESAFNISKLIIKDKLIKIAESADAVVGISKAIEKKSFAVERHLERIHEEQKPGNAAFENLIQELQANLKIKKFSYSLETPAQAHMYLETQGSVVECIEDGYVLYAGTQHPTGNQQAVAQVLGVKQNQVESKIKRIGGGFGGKSQGIIYSCYAAIVSQKHRCQASCFLDQSDDTLYCAKRHEALFTGDMYYDTETLKLKFYDAKIFLDGGWNSEYSTTVLEKLLCHMENCYKIESTRFVGLVCRTNSRQGTAFRGFGIPQCVTFLETMLQKLSTENNICMQKLRAANYYKNEDTTPYGCKLNGVLVEQCVQRALEKSKYDELKKEVQEFNLGHKMVKQGLAFMPLKYGIAYATAFLNQAYALIHCYSDGSILISHSGVEMGQGLNTKLQQIASMLLKVDVNIIKINTTSTAQVPQTPPTSASSGYDLNAGAVKAAIDKLKENLGEFYQKFESQELTWQQCCSQAWFQRKCLSAQGHYKHQIPGFNFETQSGVPSLYYTYGAAVAHVQVNKYTGEHQVLKVDLVVDAGQSVNPIIDINQAEGGFIQGVGWVTQEEMLFQQKLEDEQLVRTGKCVTTGFSNYKVPTIADIPAEFNIELLFGHKNDSVVGGCKGIGEAPLVLGSVVFMAIRDAVGLQVRVPATLMNVFVGEGKGEVQNEEK